MPVEKPARELTTHQISFDIVTRDYLKNAELRDGKYIINKVEFEVLVVPYGEWFPADLLELFGKLEANGVSVIFVDKAPKQSAFGGKTVELKQLGRYLMQYQACRLGEEQPDLAVGEYEKDGRKFYMFFNESIGHDIHTTVDFVKTGFLYRYDAMRDEIFEMCPEEFVLSLEPYESTIIIASPQKLPAENVREDRGFSGEEAALKEIKLPEKWEVWYADSLHYPMWQKQVPMDLPGLVSDLEGWEAVSGTVRYGAEINIEKLPERAVLNLGEVYETAEVFVNGQSAGVRLCGPYRFEIADLLKKGENTIAIEVTNTLGTSVRDVISHYLVMEPFGLYGNISLRTGGERR